MERRSGEAHLILRHFENLAVHSPAYVAGVLVEGGHDLEPLHPQLREAVLLGGAGEGGGLRHDQAARLIPAHLELMGNGGDGLVRGLAPYDHLRELGVDAVHQGLLVGPAAVPEGLIVHRPGPGEDLCNRRLVDGLHGPAHPKAPLKLKGGAVVAAQVHFTGGGVHKVQLIGV